MKRYSLGKGKRLVSNEQFKTVLARKLCASDDFMILYMRENDCGYPRLGVSVGKAFGKAVVRNRFKRVLREVFRQNQDRIPQTFDYLLMVSRRWSKRSEKRVCAGEKLSGFAFDKVMASFLSLVGKIAQKGG